MGEIEEMRARNRARLAEQVGASARRKSPRPGSRLKAASLLGGIATLTVLLIVVVYILSR